MANPLIEFNRRQIERGPQRSQAQQAFVNALNQLRSGFSEGVKEAQTSRSQADLLRQKFGLDLQKGMALEKFKSDLENEQFQKAQDFLGSTLSQDVAPQPAPPPDPTQEFLSRLKGFQEGRPAGQQAAPDSLNQLSQVDFQSIVQDPLVQELDQKIVGATDTLAELQKERAKLTEASRGGPNVKKLVEDQIKKIEDDIHRQATNRQKLETQRINLMHDLRKDKVRREEKIRDKLEAQNIKDTKEQAEKSTNFARTVGAFSQIVSQAKAMKEAQGGLGIIPGLKGRALALWERFKGEEGTGVSGPITAFKGQLFETALGLNNILTGQNRVIEGVLENILGTLPDEFETEGQMSSKIVQSIQNAFKIKKAFEKFGFTKDFWEALDPGQDTITSFQSSAVKDLMSQVVLTPEEQQEVNRIANIVLRTPAAKPASFEGIQGTNFNDLNPQNIIPKRDSDQIKRLGLDPSKFKLRGIKNG